MEDPYEVLTAYQKSAVVMTAVKTGLYEALRDGPKTAVDLAASLGLDVYATGVLLESLAVCGYVGRTDLGLYEHNDFSRSFLRQRCGAMARIALKEAFFYEKWAALPRAIRNGQSLLAPFEERIRTAPEEIVVFLSALNDIAAMAFPGVLHSAQFPESGSFLDFGGGMGGYAIKIAKHFPELKITLLDRPFVANLCREHLDKLELPGLFEIRDGDLFDPVSSVGEKAFDVVFVSHVIHDYPPKKAAEIVSSAAKCVKDDGRFYLLDVPRPSPDGDAAESQFNVMMLVEAPGGRTHEDSDIREWIGSAGLVLKKATKLYFGTLYEAAPAGR